VDAICYGMLLMYIGQKTLTVPLTDHTPPNHHRNERIRTRHQQGETVMHLAAAFNISEQRISQIIRGRRK
jgi:Mor family transcriptional regulator